MKPTRPLFAVLLTVAVGLVPAAGADDAARHIAERRTVSGSARPLHAGKATTERGSLLVHLKEGTTSAAAADVARDAGAVPREHIDSVDVQVVGTGGRPTSEVAERLRDDPRVEHVEPSRIRYASGDPNDPNFFGQGHLFTSRLPAAWDVTHGSPTIDIAILDTGVDLDHPDLAGRIGLKKRFVAGGTSAHDDNGHGTFVAGVAAADSDNAKGIAGSAWDARIMVGKVLGADGSGTDPDIAAGIEWATDNGAEIINLSLGGPGFSQILADAVTYAVTNGVTVIAAAGNESSDVPSYPAALSNVVAVGATDVHGNVVGFSNRGPHVDVVAQGFDVLSTALAPGATEAYAIGAGTSFSAPLVSGVVALVKARNPTFTPAQIASRLRKTAIDRGPRGIDDAYGWGLVDAYAAIGGKTAASPPQAVRDAGEPDDVAASARPVGSGAQGTISPEGDVDWYSVVATGAGTITFTVTPPVVDDGQGPQTFDPVIDAFGPNLESMGSFDPNGGGQAEVATINVSGAGTYLFRVANFATSRSTGTQTAPDAYDVTGVFVSAAVAGSLGAIAWVDDTTPDPFAEGVASSVSPTVTFARAVTKASAESAAKVALVDAKTGAAVSASRTYDSPTKTVTIDPVANLVSGRTYVVTVRGVTDGSQTMTDVFASRFTIAAPAPAPDLRADFNNDGFEDTVIGVPGEGHGAKAAGGVVHVLYGSASGARGVGSQMWSQNSPGIAGVVEAGDRFGQAVATGDVNNDGYDDLIVGAPYEDIGKAPDAGVIHVILGSSKGLVATGSQIWSQNSPGVPGGCEKGDLFGASLATGRFDNAAGLDVAVGSPGEGIGAATKAGAVHVFSGSSTGITGTGSKLWAQSSAGIDFFPEAGDAFGYSLASGDFHGDGHDDLAIGAPTDNIAGDNEGTVMLMRGSIVGLRPAVLLGDVFGSQSPEPGDRYGTSVSIADLGGYGATDGYADLVVGIPGESVPSATNGGAVDVVYSDHTEPWWAAARLDQATFGMGALETKAWFGWTSSARTLLPSGIGPSGGGTLVIGAPFASVGAASDAGLVHTYRPGSSLGPQGQVLLEAVAVFHQDTTGVPGTAEANDRFAAAVSLLDVDGDDAVDLAVGAPLESLGSASQAGAVFVIRGVAGAAPKTNLFTQASSGIGSAPETNDLFGASL